MKDITNPLYTAILRQKAEEILKNRNVKFNSENIDGETYKLIHELDVHQIELEMQNEELVLAKKSAETDAEKYSNLYDFAPFGYLTLSKEGEIIELNFCSANILGKERSLLMNNRFGFFVSDETRTVFNEFIDNLYKGNIKETCELTLNINPSAPTYVNLIANTSHNNTNCHIIMIDISQRKKLEEEVRASEEKYRCIFDNNKQSIIISIIEQDLNNNKENILNVNDAASKLYGYSKEEMLLLNFNTLNTIPSKTFQNRDKELLKKGKIRLNTVANTKKGNKKNIEIDSFLIKYEGQPAIINFLIDKT